MIFLTASSDGNVGKTTLVRYALVPGLKARLIEVEQVQVADDRAAKSVAVRDSSGAKGKAVLTAVLLASLSGDTVVDVGASHFDDLISLLASARPRLESTDITLITPAVAAPPLRKTIAHLDKIAVSLDAIQLPRLKRVLVANRVEPSEEHAKACGELAAWAANHGYRICRTVLPEAGIFTQGATMGYDIEALAGADTAKLEAAAAKAIDSGDEDAIVRAGEPLRLHLEAQRVAPMLRALVQEIAGG